jgi:GntP family gluconate:H+ symporter
MGAGMIVGVICSIDPSQVSINPLNGKPMITDTLSSLDLLMQGFGSTAGSIAFSIALASIIGLALMKSGAADSVVSGFLKLFGEKYSGVAILVASYLLSVPIFFDTMFMLMAPLAKSLSRRTGKNYALYLICICCGSSITHCLTIPHPGPIAAVETLKLDPGQSILAGFCIGIIPCAFAYFVASYINRRISLYPPQETTIDSDSDTLPSFLTSITPVVLPIFLISLSSFVKIIQPEWPSNHLILQYQQLIHFFGNKNIALSIGTLLAVYLWLKQKKINKHRIAEELSPAMDTAGMIILITSAGGAFGSMIKHAGVGRLVESLAASYSISLLLLAYLITVILRLAQGSATVAMITASSIMYPMIQSDIGYHPMYIYLAIGFGSFFAPWMNDSGFWVVTKLSGIKESDTLKTMTLSQSLVSLCGFLTTIAASTILPR